MKHCLFCLSLLWICSCTAPKNFVYFENSPLQQAELKTSSAKPLVIQADDILAIQVSTLDGKSSDPYNFVRSDANNNAQVLTDFLVDKQGYVDYPGLGKLAVAGKTTGEVKAMLLDKLSPFLADAVVNVRILNFTITVLGEVRNPARYIIQGENFTLLEALGQAGDLTDFGDREHVTVIRKGVGASHTVELSLLSTALFESEYFYLKQDDVIYIPPLKQKAISSRTRPLTGLVLPTLGVLASLASLVIVATR